MRRFKKQSNCVYDCTYHIVLPTKYRKKIFNDSVFAFLKKCYFGRDGIWSEGYLVSRIGLNEKIIRRYIEKQGQEDLGETGYLFE